MFFGAVWAVVEFPSHANAGGGGVTIGTPKRRVAARERDEKSFICNQPSVAGGDRTMGEAKPAAATCIQVTVLFRRFRK
jgi:hypothetical protein